MSLTNYSHSAYNGTMLLREWRKLNGLSMEQAAARFGVSQPSISRLESGKSRPDWSTLERIVAATNGKVTPNDFLAENEDAA